MSRAKQNIMNPASQYGDVLMFSIINDKDEPNCLLMNNAKTIDAINPPMTFATRGFSFK